MQIGHLKVQELMQRFGLYAIVLDARKVPLGCARDSKRMTRRRPTRNIVRLRFGALLRLFERRFARKGIVAEQIVFVIDFKKGVRLCHGGNAVGKRGDWQRKHFKALH